MDLKHYVAFFRGINVSSTTKVAMTDLRTIMRTLGYEDIKTYIQSGNALFSTSDVVSTVDIETAFEKRFGFRSMVTLRSEEEMGKIIGYLPFSQADLDAADAASNTVSLYVYLFENILSQPDRDAVESFSHPTDRLVAHSREIYLLCHESIRFSPAATVVAGLSQQATARNWNTLNKVFSLFKV